MGQKVSILQPNQQAVVGPDMLTTFIAISGILFVLGAVLGSFLNVIIYRTVNDESWVWGRSKCEHCDKQIAWYDNIPVVSFLWLRAKCRACRKPISLTHPVVEFLTGVLFVWWYWGGFIFFQLTQRPFQTLQPLFWLAVGLILLAIFFADLLYYQIPDILAGSLLVITIMYRVALTLAGVMQVKDLGFAVMGFVLSVVFFGSLYLITKGKGMGLGDVKLIGPLSLLVGWPGIILVVFGAFLSGATVSLGMVATKRRKFGQIVPFGPFLVFATLLTLVWGDPIMNWYMGLL